MAEILLFVIGLIVGVILSSWGYSEMESDAARHGSIKIGNKVYHLTEVRR